MRTVLKVDKKTSIPVCRLSFEAFLKEPGVTEADEKKRYGATKNMLHETEKHFYLEVEDTHKKFKQ